VADFNAVTTTGKNNLYYEHYALFDKLKLLKQNGVEAIGAGENIDEARKPQ
jgi:hypothetical protein